MNFHENKAIYLQIADYFFDRILQKKLKPDERIPSVREMAIKTEVNPNTVMRTYNYLQSEDIIYNKRGIGYFINSLAYDKALNTKKSEFIADQVPKFFKTMNTLGLKLSDVEKMYIEFKSNENDSEQN